MNLTDLTKITTKSNKRVGRGHGSGRGKTSGRGTKGQLARHNSPLDFDGDANPLIRRLPFLRGKGRNKSIRVKPFVLNVRELTKFSEGDVVDFETVSKKLAIDVDDLKKYGIKVLGDGEIKKPLTIKVPISKNAAKKIEKAGGTIE